MEQKLLWSYQRWWKIWQSMQRTFQLGARLQPRQLYGSRSGNGLTVASTFQDVICYHRPVMKGMTADRKLQNGKGERCDLSIRNF